MKIRSGRAFSNPRNSLKEGVLAYNVPVPASERSTYARIDRISMKKERPTSVVRCALQALVSFVLIVSCSRLTWLTCISLSFQ